MLNVHAETSGGFKTNAAGGAVVMKAGIYVMVTKDIPVQKATSASITAGVRRGVCDMLCTMLDGRKVQVADSAVGFGGVLDVRHGVMRLFIAAEV